MAKQLNQLNVNLSFNADASKAKKVIADLQSSLNQLATMNIGDNLKLKEASNAAKELSYHLNQAYNATTGNIDLSKLNNSLQKSSTNVTILSNKLLEAGSIGQQSFINLAKAISSADYPMVKLNSRLTEMWTTLKNTARWQLSSSILHGFIGTVQKAYGYAQDLNESLNNIRIVTGQNTDEMARFAQEANRAAKSLSTSTTDYTNASLIYYQQGLSDKEVQERTNVTIKMANAAGVSAQTVSDQLTAVWNNFYDGSQSLEYYADVMTALGAATASSTDEISVGLNKFAAVADTVGLSYEYATSALATVTATTRESADVVGTAFKTLFARIQGLTLGETLDDGTDLNKYSDALNKVGIDIKTANGEMKDMDTILNELGEKWQMFGKDQQIALAQTVAGVRQYTQLVALMDNWDYFQENLNVASGAAGALQEQADIYAESWEAASKRAKTAAQGVYDSLINENLFIGFNNVLADLLTGVENVIDGLGGMKGVVSAVGTFLLSLFSHKIQPAIQQLTQNIRVLFQSAQSQASQLVSEMQAKTTIEIKSGNYDTAQIQQLKNTALLSEARARLTVASKNLTEQEQLLYQFDISNMEITAQKAEAIATNIAHLEKEAGMLIVSADAIEVNNNANRTYNQLLKEQMTLSAEAFDRATSAQGTSVDYKEYFAAEEAIDLLEIKKIELNEAINESVSALLQEYEQMQRNNVATDEFTISTEDAMKGFQDMISSLEAIPKKSSLDSYKSALEMIYKSLPSIARKSPEVQKALKKAFDASDVRNFKNGLKNMSDALGKITIKGKDLSRVIQELNPKAYQELEKILKQIKQEEQNLIPIQKQLSNALNNFNPTHMVSGIERLSAAAGALGQVAMMGQSISSMVDAWNNTDLSFGEKLSTTFMSLSMLIPGVISSMKGLSTVLQGTTLHSWAYVASVKAQTHSVIAAEGAKQLLLIAGGKEFTQTGALMAAQYLLGDSYKTSSFEKRRAAEASFNAALAENGLTKAGFEAALSQMAASLGLDKTAIAALRAKLSVDALKTSLSTLLPIIALIIAAITALVAGISAYNKAQEEAAERHRAADQEKIDSVLKEAEAYEAARTEYSKLLDVYEEAIASSDGTVTAQQAIANATWDLCDALEVEVNLLDRLQGKSEKYIFEARAKAADEALEQLKDYQEDVETLSQGILNAYQEMDNVSWHKNLTYNPESMGFGKGVVGTTEQGNTVYSADWGTLGADEQTITRAIADFIYSDNFKYAGKVDTYTGNELEFAKNITPEEQYEIITYIMDYVSKNTDRADQDKSEVYTWFRDIIKAGKEPYNQLNELNIDENISEYAMAAAEAEEQQLISSISTYEDYIEMQNTLATKIQDGYLAAGLSIDAEAAKQLAIELMSTKENIQNLVGLEEVSKKTGITLNKIKTLYEKYGSELFWQINFDEIKSEKDLETLLEKLQNAANAEAIQIKLNIIEDAKNKLKPGMGIDDYATFENESGIKWGAYDEHYKQNIVEYNEFLQMSYNQQMDYLNRIQDGYENAQLENLNNSIQNWKTVSEDYQAQYNKIQNKIESTKWSNEDSQKARDLEQKIARYQELYDYAEDIGDTDRMEDDMRIINNAMQELNALIHKYGGDTNYVTAEDLQELNRLEALIKEETANVEQYEAQIQSIVNGRLGAVQTLTELENELQTLSQVGIDTFNYDTYAEALIKIGQEYDNCVDEIEQYQEALSLANADTIKAAEQALHLAITIGELAEVYNLEIEILETQTEIYSNIYKNLNLKNEEYARLAAQNQRMNSALETLIGNWEDYAEILKISDENTIKADKGSMEYAETISDLQDIVIDLTGANLDLALSAEFVEDNIGLIRDAADGAAGALQKLGTKVAQFQVDSLTSTMQNLQTVFGASYSLAQRMPGGNPKDPIQRVLWGEEDGSTTHVKTEEELKVEFEAAKNNVIEGMQKIQNAIDEGDLKLGEKINDLANVPDLNFDEWIQSINDVATAAGMTKEELLSMFEAMGMSVDPENIVVTKVELTESVPKYKSTITPIDGGRGGYTMETAQDGYTTMTTEKQVATLGKSPKIIYTDNGTTNTGNRDSNKKTSKTDSTKKSDVVDRYKEIDDQLDDSSREMNKASKAADRLWGPERIAAMEEANKALEENIDLLKQKRKEAEENLEIDKQALQDTLAKNGGISAQFDDQGNIINYDEIMANLFNQLEAAEKAAGAEWDEKEQEKINGIQERIDKVKEAISQYDETKELIQDLDQEIIDAIYEWQDNNYEILNLELEFKVEINDSKLEYIDYYLSKIEDDIYATAEAYGYLAQQQGIYEENFANQDAYVKQLTEDYYAGKISLADYKDGLQNSQGAILSNLSSLQELKETMQDYYGNVMSKALEEISLYTDQMDHLNSVLDHYSNILDIIGKQKDYKTKGSLLNAQAINLQNEMQVQQELYEHSSAEAEKWAKKMAEAIPGSNEYETYKKNWIAAQEAANEAQDAILSKTAEWAEAMKAIVENELSELASIMEKSLTGGISFDELLSNMEHRSSLQEEYLTTTNQIYETNKLMRQAQQELDKTSNTAAKRRLQNFIKETSEMQNQAKLSQFEFDIQQAKYDLLLAEIALEEAQNAKSTVRLQRDSEGNFGYVYTADANAVADAEQNLADKQNALYNLGLEGANEYSQKYAETMQAAQDDITELTQMWMNGEIEAEEEFNRRKEEIIAYYTDKLKGYSHLYQVAITTDTAIIGDAWSSKFSSMMDDTKNWKIEVDKYFVEAGNSITTWKGVCATVAENTGLDNIAGLVENVTNKSNALKEILIGEDGKGGVVDAMMNEAKAAGEVSDAYISVQNEIDKTIDKYEDLLDIVNGTYSDPNIPIVEPPISPEGNPEPEPKPGPGSNPGTGPTTYDTTTKQGVALAIWSGDYGWGTGVTRKQRLEEKGFDYSEIQTLVNNTDLTGDWKKRYGIYDLSPYSYESFDTGGYTGDWVGSYGKLAMLHKKELILKENDTENFLASMNVLERILQILDLQSTSAQLGGILTSPGFAAGGNEVLEQNVHIEANFPNATNRFEIEEAFKDIVNLASQYANRK